MIPSPSPRLRVVLAGEHRLHREALAEALEGELGARVAGVVADGEAAVASVQAKRPEVLVVPVDLPLLSGIDACAEVRRRVPETRVVVLGPGDDPEVLLAAVEAGANGYADLDGPLTGALDAIRRVHGGETVVPQGMLGGLLKSLIARRRAADQAFRRFLRLTGREREVLELLVEGCDPGEMASILQISPATARTHIRNLLGKLEVHSRVAAVALAAEHGWVRAGPAGPTAKVG